MGYDPYICYTSIQQQQQQQLIYENSTDDENDDGSINTLGRKPTDEE